MMGAKNQLHDHDQMHNHQAYADDHEHEMCREYLGNLSEYLDGTLAEELCHELEAHMATCDNCRVVVNTLSKTISLYKTMPAPEMPSAVKERLYKVLDLEPFYAASSSGTTADAHKPQE